MNTILIQQVLLNGKRCDVWIEGNKIGKIADSITDHADKTINGAHKALIPGFANAHAHSAMTLFRGLGEDISLMKWLHEYIWPYEARLDKEMIYWGVKLACVEMIRSGITACNDMYWSPHASIEAMEEMGLRSVQSYVWIDTYDCTDRKPISSIASMEA